MSKEPMNLCMWGFELEFNITKKICYFKKEKRKSAILKMLKFVVQWFFSEKYLRKVPPFMFQQIDD